MTQGLTAAGKRRTVREEVQAWVMEACDAVDQATRDDCVTRLERAINLKRHLRAQGENLVRALNEETA